VIVYEEPKCAAAMKRRKRRNATDSLSDWLRSDCGCTFIEGARNRICKCSYSDWSVKWCIPWSDMTGYLSLLLLTFPVRGCRGCRKLWSDWERLLWCAEAQKPVWATRERPVTYNLPAEVLCLLKKDILCGEIDAWRLTWHWYSVCLCYHCSV